MKKSKTTEVQEPAFVRQDSLESKLGKFKTGEPVNEELSQAFNHTNSLIQTLIKDCDAGIDYSDRQDSHKEQRIVRKHNTRKVYVDNRKLTGEYKARQYHKQIQKNIDSASHKMEKWQKALDDLILIQQDQTVHIDYDELDLEPPKRKQAISLENLQPVVKNKEYYKQLDL